jgi:hypothetical protein
MTDRTASQKRGISLASSWKGKKSISRPLFLFWPNFHGKQAQYKPDSIATWLNHMDPVSARRLLIPSLASQLCRQFSPLFQFHNSTNSPPGNLPLPPLPQSFRRYPHDKHPRSSRRSNHHFRQGTSEKLRGGPPQWHDLDAPFLRELWNEDL